MDLGAKRLELTRPGDAERQVVVPREQDRAEWSAEIDFVAAIRRERPVTLTDFATGLGYMAFLEAVARSAASGCRTVIDGGAIA
ncbi:MAG: hypothetical protein H0U58_00395 [Chloroflexi bacterium]|nr:hypothetical protein [Chloroflexota bacterium]